MYPGMAEGPDSPHKNKTIALWIKMWYVGSETKGMHTKNTQNVDLIIG